MSLAADPAAVLADDAVSVWEVLGIAGERSGEPRLPEWYMPAPMAGARPVRRRWHRFVAVAIIAFDRPEPVPDSPAAMANELGLHSVAFEVDDIDAAVDQAASAGYRLVGGIGEYEGSWRMAYVRSPEGIIVALAESTG